jgi:ABC-type lipoprotein export system ATPase subunit
VRAGEFAAVLGRSGSGKSTFLHLAGGLLVPDAGEILFENEVINNLSAKKRAEFRNRKIGFVFQDFFLFHEFSLLENVMVPLLVRGQNHQLASEAALSQIEKVGLSGKEQNRPGELSGGQRQRAAIARALVGEPKLLLADEPTGNLDEHTGQEIMNLLRDLHKNHALSIVLVTHDQELADSADRRIFIEDGRISTGINS